MTIRTKQQLYNLNLFILMIFIGVLMFWKKQDRNTTLIDNQQNISSSVTPATGNNILSLE